MPCAPRCCRGFANSASPQTVQIPFSAASPVLGCVPMGFSPPPFVLPRLADGGGKRRGNCLRAKPEFFRVPPSSRSKGSPQGQDWLGCLFLVSSFGHAKEEREHGREAIFILRNSLMKHKRKGRSPCGAPAFLPLRVKRLQLNDQSSRTRIRHGGTYQAPRSRSAGRS